MRSWIEPTPVDIPEAFQASVGGHPLVARVLMARGMDTVEAVQAFFDPSKAPSADPFDLPGMQTAVNRLQSAIRDQEALVVWGDFDVDGQTSTALLVSVLSKLGAKVSFHIPVREKESHGVNLPVLKTLIAGGARLILTCDTGITAHEAVDYARSQGVDFLISDHHDLPPELPDALAAVDPKRLPRDHPLSALPGVGVAYELAEALCRQVERTEIPPQFLDLVALGIVADLARQTGETRRLLQRGLAALRHTQRAGLKALMEIAEVDQANLTEEHIGFMLGPRLNALGRLDDANVSVEFLTTADAARARVIATQLDGLNTERKLLTDQVYQGALAQIERQPELLEESALVLAHPAWPGGVIGIVASRLVERYHRPVVMITAPPGQIALGSARSIEGVNITAAIAAHQDQLAGFGGHPMAAGLSFAASPDIIDHIAVFRKSLSHTVRAMAGDLNAETSLAVDGALLLPDLSLDLVTDLERLAPFGPGNPPLTLSSRELILIGQTKIGRNDEHLVLTVEDKAGSTQKVIWWNAGSDIRSSDLPKGRFDLAYSVRASNYRGQTEVQVEWIDARLLEEIPPAGVPTAQVEIRDLRLAHQPMPVIKSVLEQGDALVWAEADAVDKLAAVGILTCARQEIKQAHALVIWTAPPSGKDLRSVLEIAGPQVIYLVCIPPEAITLGTFKRRLIGLVKYTLSTRQGRSSLTALAGACAQCEATVQKGLEWLAARGHITLLSQAEGMISLAEGGQVNRAIADNLAAQIQYLIEESAAYRTFFAGASAENLLSFYMR